MARSLTNISARHVLGCLIALQAVLAFWLRGYLDPTSAPNAKQTLKRRFGSEAQLVVKLQTTQSNISDDPLVTKGLHDVEIMIDNSVCHFPRFWVRLIGDAMVAIHLKEERQGFWKGQFSFPMAGSFSIDARWYGCSPEEQKWEMLDEPIRIMVPSVTFRSPHHENESLFTAGGWMSTKLMTDVDVILPDYIWKKPLKEESLSSYTRLTAAETSVLIEGTKLGNDGFHRFGELGNYELLCFMGSESAAQIRSVFLQLRPHLFRNQRPFKFHFYNVTDFVHPDKEWNLETKQRVRKCKHILLSVDELRDSVSQAEYKQQLTTFVNHLLKLMNDTTFPIRILTVNEPPMQAKNCLPRSLPPTTEHPCNDVIFSLFDRKAFPDRVKLFDNTDVSNPQFGDHKNDVLIVIALRIFVVVGKQVADWRAMGQRGMIDGLHRNGTVEPNFELVPYTGWS